MSQLLISSLLMRAAVFDVFPRVLPRQSAFSPRTSAFFLTVWTQLAYHFNWRTAKPLGALNLHNITIGVRLYLHHIFACHQARFRCEPYDNL